MNPGTTVLSVYPVIPMPERGTGRATLCSLAIHIFLLLLLASGLHWQRNSTPQGTEAGMEAQLITRLPNLDSPAAAVSIQHIAPQPDKTADIALAPKHRAQVQRMQMQKQHDVRSQKINTQLLRQQQLLAQQKYQKKQQIQQRKTPTMLQTRIRHTEIPHLKKMHQSHIQALKAQAAHRRITMGGTTIAGHHNGTGGYSPGYANKVRQRVRPNIIFDASSIPGNLQTVVDVHCAPDGALLQATIAQSSGNAVWDEAVLRAVEKSDPMPRDMNGYTPGRFTITFEPGNEDRDD